VEQPENTIEAFEAAIDAGADAVEFDVRLTSDGLPVVIHDPDVSRTTGGQGLVSGLTVEEIRALGVPTLEETLACLSGRAAADIELKNEPNEPGYLEDGAPALEATLETLDRVAFPQPVLLSSFDPATLRRSRELRPVIPTGLLTSAETDAATALRAAVADGHPWVLPFVAQVLDAGSAFVDEVHEAGMRVGIWIADDPEMAQTLFSMGVDAVATNDPRAIVAVSELPRYSPRDLQVLSGTDVVTRLAHWFFPSGPFTPERAIEHLRDEAKVLGIEIKSREADGWWVVWASQDWIPSGAEEIRTFTELRRFPEAGVNAHRSEVFLTTFARVVVTATHGRITVVRDDLGRASEARHRFAELIDRRARTIVFLS
jgi:glycerophosphoryl diester phosphodiesterase